ncbi:unnamed protein product, partial [Staurois parvus]
MQAGSISIGQVGTGGASGEWSGVTGQVQQVASSIVQRVRQRDGPGHKPGIRTGSKQRRSEQEKSAKEQKQDAGQIQAQDKHNTKAESASLA